LTTALLMLAAALFTILLETARASFDLLLSVGAGTGLLYLLRWFWWRINAWSEIAAMVSSFLLAAALFLAQRGGAAIPSHVSLLLMVATTTVIWVVTAYVTRPTEVETLQRFYRIARPGGPGWRTIRAACPDVDRPDDLRGAFAGWLAGVALVYGALFGTGHLLLGHRAAGLVGVSAAVVGVIVLARVLPHVWSKGRVMLDDRPQP
jgi:solute:Na+ symporter, SSS family